MIFRAKVDFACLKNLKTYPRSRACSCRRILRPLRRQTPGRRRASPRSATAPQRAGRRATRLTSRNRGRRAGMEPGVSIKEQYKLQTKKQKQTVLKLPINYDTKAFKYH